MSATAVKPAAPPPVSSPDGAATPAADWQGQYLARVVLVDCLAIFVGLAVALVSRFGLSSQASVLGFSYDSLAFCAGPLWIAALALQGAYRPRLLGSGAGEFKRVMLATIRLASATAIVSYALKAQLARGFVALAFPISLSLLLLGRYACRRWLHAQRSAGLCTHRVLAVGDRQHLDRLADVMRRERYAGYQVVAACVPGAVVPAQAPLASGVPVAGPLSAVVAAARDLQVDTIAITSSPGITADAVRRLSWELEGSGIGMLLAPALTDVAGPRIHITQVAGLPLLHVEEPEFTGMRRVAKEVLDRLAAAVVLALVSPVLLAIAVAVRLSSPGPALFRQRRVGLNGRSFGLVKFRSMYADAEQRLAELTAANEADPSGLLFKMRADPRVTRVGRWLRRYSLDELPQLWNVVRGDMAVVGPRPPLQSEVDRYASDVRRRLLVKPGITGLWQVSGRSDLSWQDSIRLDLYYVENWSPALDLMIIWKTLFAVLRGAGAY